MNDNDNAGGSNPGEGNSTPDNQDPTPLTHADPDLRPIKLILLPFDMEHGMVTLNIPEEGGPLRVWKDAKKNATPTTWNLDDGEQLPSEVYLEGHVPGGTGVLLTFEYPDKLLLADTVIMTVMKLELSMTNYLGIDITGTTGKVASANASLTVIPGGVVTNYIWTLAGSTVFTNGVKTTNTTSSSMMVYETGEASASYEGESLNVRVLPSGFSIHTNFTVVKVDIDWPGVAETNEETLGAWVAYNGDDDDTNGVIDALQGAMENGIEDDDLVEITLTVMPDDLPTNETKTVPCDGCWLDRQKLTNAAGEYAVRRFPLKV